MNHSSHAPLAGLPDRAAWLADGAMPYGDCMHLIHSAVRYQRPSSPRRLIRPRGASKQSPQRHHARLTRPCPAPHFPSTQTRLRHGGRSTESVIAEGGNEFTQGMCPAECHHAMHQGVMHQYPSTTPVSCPSKPAGSRIRCHHPPLTAPGGGDTVHSHLTEPPN